MMKAKQKRIKPIFYGTALAVALSCWTPGLVRAEETPATPPTAEQTQTTKQQDKVSVTEVEVRADKEPKSTAQEGSAEAGYKADNTTTTGPWGIQKLQDVPYSINVMSSDLIKNVQAGSREELFKMNPVVQASQGDTSAGNLGVNLRGFPTTSGQYQDGIPGDPYGIYLEDKERVEVLTGLSGFLYGGGNVGGIINYVLKRPTDVPLANVTVGSYGGSNYYAHADLGGPLSKDGKFGYRLNVVTQNGNTAVDDQKTKRNLISGALDYHISSNALLQFDASYVHSRQESLLPFWIADSYPSSPPDTSKDWGEPYTRYDFDKTRLGTKFTWDIDKSLSLRSGYSYTRWNDNEYLKANNFIQNNGTYDQSIFTIAPYYTENTGGYAFLDAKFTTGSIHHKVTTGYSGFTASEYDPSDIFASRYVTGLSLSQPTNVSQPFFTVGTQPKVKASESVNRNWIIGDELTFNNRWSSLIGFNHTEIIARNYNTTTGALTSQYDKSATTPSVSLIYKPMPTITTYATYMESLEQGATVPNDLFYTNHGQVFEPMVSKQFDVGAKATVGGTLLTVALFKIDKANQFAVNNGDGTYTYVQDGREVHKGVEFTVSGKVTERLTLIGGLTLMNCKVTQEADNPTLEGKQPVNVSNQMVKFFAEYELPQVPGLTLTGGAYYTGSFYADAANTNKLPGVVIGAFGARYKTTVYGTPVIYRLNVTNITNKNYWVYGGIVGAPRSVALSMEMKL
ncbi:MAG TPA: TonB-dependent siderophore receptor [Negativicutes bacterium]